MEGIAGAGAEEAVTGNLGGVEMRGGRVVLIDAKDAIGCLAPRGPAPACLALLR